MLVTLKITPMALTVAVTVAVIGAVALAILFTQNKFAEMAFLAYAVILQVTPIMSVAPLIFSHVDNRIVALLSGAVVAEYVAGTGDIGSGQAFRILEAGYRLNIPRLFAALFLIAFLGVVIFMATTILNWFLLHKWHESTIKRDT